MVGLPALQRDQHRQGLEVGLELERAHQRGLGLGRVVHLLVEDARDLAQDLLAPLDAAGRLELLLERDDVLLVLPAAGEHRAEALERLLVGGVELEDPPQRGFGRGRIVELGVLHLRASVRYRRSASGPRGTVSAISSYTAASSS